MYIWIIFITFQFRNIVRFDKTYYITWLPFKSLKKILLLYKVDKSTPILTARSPLFLLHIFIVKYF